MSDVDPRLVTHFNQAAALARAGEHASSLSAYQQLLARAKAEGLAASPEFVATAELRLGYCLMDLGRYEEAAAHFAGMGERRYALSDENRYELHFAHGNTLGNLKRLDAMFSELIDAVSVSEDLDDYVERPLRCWRNILAFAEQAKAWDFLEAKAAIALNNARLRRMRALEIYAAEQLELALRQKAARS